MNQRICGAQSEGDDDDPPVTCTAEEKHEGDHIGGTRCGTVTWPRRHVLIPGEIVESDADDVRVRFSAKGSSYFNMWFTQDQLQRPTPNSTREPLSPVERGPIEVRDHNAVRAFFSREIGQVPGEGSCHFAVDGRSFFEALVELVAKVRNEERQRNEEQVQQTMPDKTFITTTTDGRITLSVDVRRDGGAYTPNDDKLIAEALGKLSRWVEPTK